MPLRRLRTAIAHELPGTYFFAVAAMGPAAVVAILALREVHWVAPTPLWVVPTILIGGQIATTLTGVWWQRSESLVALHGKVAMHVGVVTAAIYATGWGPALGLGLVIIGQETLTSAGSAARRIVLGWEVTGILVGQFFVAMGWAPSLIPSPQVHGLAILTIVGIAFAQRSLSSALHDKEQANATTEQHERKFRALLQSSHDLVFVFDMSSSVTYASPSCLQVLGYAPTTFLGPNQQEHIHHQDIEALRLAMQNVVSEGHSPVPLLFRLRRSDESWCWVEGVATNLVEDTAVAGIVVNVHDVTDRIASEEAMRQLALHDPLTGLANRALFADRLEHAISRRQRTGTQVAALIVDLDGFKTVNDSLGHAMGDALLIGVGQRFSQALRAHETIARLGGDEFAVLIEDLEQPEQAIVVAQRVLSALQAPITIPGRDVAIAASVGIAIAEHDEGAAERVLGQADAAMYRAKREGKGCYRVFEQSMLTAAMQRLELEQDLRAAIAADGLDVSYQPIVAVPTDTVIGFEALARWHHPQRGLIAPNEFIPVADETNLIVDVGRNVLVRACRQAAHWRAEYGALELSIAVNVSQRQLAQPSFVTELSEILTATALPPTALVVEVTESVLAADTGRVVNTLEQLRGLGVRIAIDDFGTGYSSFASLAELPIDIIKIDKRFIDNVATDHQGRGFVNAIIQLASTLGLETIAEGVERPEQREALRELGGTHLQGYVYAPALTPSEAEQYLTTRNAPPEAEQPTPYMATSVRPPG
jgi:diguanylate cyclase (GGDEF)-like protein/PAS domain S-box-containing protein